MKFTRRNVLAAMGAGGLSLLPFSRAFADDLPSSLLGTNPIWIPSNAPITPVPTTYATAGRVVVIGGGMAGTTVAKYLRIWGGSKVQVTLVEPSSAYVANIMSNLVLNNQVSQSSLYFNWNRLTTYYGVQRIQGTVSGIDPVNRKVTLAGGSTLSYDRLVVAPGIEMDVVPGLESAAAQALVPHAWMPGTQISTLRTQIQSMAAGGTFLISVPKAPYRCPPGPYERACVVADYFRVYKPGSKVIVLDENPAIVAEAHTFTNAFASLGIIYRPSTAVVSVDAVNRSVVTSAGTTIKASVLNIIPNHRAGRVLSNNGLVNVGGRWAGVDVLTYQSTVAGASNIHIIGDSTSSGQPKSGHIGNQEAKICADAIVRAFLGLAPDQQVVTNTACYSPVSATKASWLTAIYAYDPLSQAMKVTANSPGEALSPSSDNLQEMRQWFSNLMTDSFA
ncbi:MAG TPA: FAD/NAD(P)-binding oxidoreductase [Accumulibacter sp.]|nr:FAD/NAD(P)-binding oxidoreductase [Accumulibacter sp.]